MSSISGHFHPKNFILLLLISILFGESIHARPSSKLPLKQQTRGANNRQDKRRSPPVRKPVVTAPVADLNAFREAFMSGNGFVA
jgi:hypothetical protein